MNLFYNFVNRDKRIYKVIFLQALIKWTTTNLENTQLSMLVSAA